MIAQADTLAARFGVSRTPVRQAIARLAMGDLPGFQALATAGAKSRLSFTVTAPTAPSSATLGAVATLSYEAGPGVIQRLYRKRMASIQADFAPGVASGAATDAVDKTPTMKAILAAEKAGNAVVSRARVGNEQAMAQMMGGMLIAILAGIALIFATVVLIKMKRERHAWITAVPMTWLLICTLYAGWLKVFSANPRIGFLAQADKYGAALAKGELLAPAKSLAQMQQIVLNNRIDAGLALLFMSVVVVVFVLALRTALASWRSRTVTALEAPYVAVRGKDAPAAA